MGWFEPTELGERFLPALTSLGAYHEAISRDVAERSLPSGEPVDAGARHALARDALHYKTTDQAAIALRDLVLELRDADGNVVPTEHISLQDTEYLMALADDEDVDEWDLDSPEELDEPDEFSSALAELGIEDDLDAPADDAAADATHDEQPDWDDSKSTLPRYQIFVELADGKSLPIPDRWKDDPYVQLLVSGFDPLAEHRNTGGP